MTPATASPVTAREPAVNGPVADQPLPSQFLIGRFLAQTVGELGSFFRSPWATIGAVWGRCADNNATWFEYVVGIVTAAAEEYLRPKLKRRLKRDPQPGDFDPVHLAAREVARGCLQDGLIFLPTLRDRIGEFLPTLDSYRPPIPAQAEDQVRGQRLENIEAGTAIPYRNRRETERAYRQLLDSLAGLVQFRPATLAWLRNEEMDDPARRRDHTWSGLLARVGVDYWVQRHQLDHGRLSTEGLDREFFNRMTGQSRAIVLELMGSETLLPNAVNLAAAWSHAYPRFEEAIRRVRGIREPRRDARVERPERPRREHRHERTPEELAAQLAREKAAIDGKEERTEKLRDLAEQMDGFISRQTIDHACDERGPGEVNLHWMLWAVTKDTLRRDLRQGLGLAHRDPFPAPSGLPENQQLWKLVEVAATEILSAATNNGTAPWDQETADRLYFEKLEALKPEAERQQELVEAEARTEETEATRTVGGPDTTGPTSEGGANPPPADDDKDVIDADFTVEGEGGPDTEEEEQDRSDEELERARLALAEALTDPELANEVSLDTVKRYLDTLEQHNLAELAEQFKVESEEEAARQWLFNAALTEAIKLTDGIAEYLRTKGLTIVPVEHDGYGQIEALAKTLIAYATPADQIQARIEAALTEGQLDQAIVREEGR